jgi:uncharacterized membrane protein
VSEAYIVRNRYPAFLAYLVPIFWLYVLFFRKDDEFAVYHARQSLMLTIAAIGVPVAWAVFAWAMLWLPTAGPLMAAAAFALVMPLYILLAVCWVVGMAYALQEELKPLPVLGGWAERIPVGSKVAR